MSLLDMLLSEPSSADRVLGLLGMLQQSGSSTPGAGPSLSSPSSSSGGVDVLNPNDPSLVTRRGVTLQDEAMQSYVQALRQYGALPGARELRYGGGGYRSPAQQEAIYAQKPDLAAPPGSSYHQEGLAIDLASQLQNPQFAKILSQLGWNQFDSAKEPWHWSYGVTG